MKKFFVEEEQIQDNKINIVGEDVNHIKNVLRLNVDEEILICNNTNSENYICAIKEISKKEVICEIKEKKEAIAESNVKIDIFQGLPKADKMELIIQKGTELGVMNFIPVKFKRTIVKIESKDEVKKIARWQKIAEVAAKQSGRDVIPKIKNIENIKSICNLIQEYDIVLLAYEEEKENTLKNELSKLENKDLKIAVIIGPEGGIEKEEVQILSGAGAKVITLGRRILRTETVALVMAAIINYELENTEDK